jgi:GntR family transcriptional regulator
VVYYDIDLGHLGPAPPLSRDRGMMLHAQISHWLIGQLSDGRVAVGARLPGERSLASYLGVSRMTLRQALDELERAGFVTRNRGRGGGAVVASPRVECDLSGLPGFSHQVRESNLAAGSRVLVAELAEAAGSVAKALGLSVGSPVYRIERIRLANGAPLAIERSVFPAGLCAGMLDRPLEGSLYELLAELGLEPHSAREKLQSVGASETDADLLEVGVGDPVTMVERVASTSSGAPVEFSIDMFRGDRVQFVVNSRLLVDPATGRTIAVF